MADETKNEEVKKDAKKPVIIRYTGEGAFFIGIPAKDLTEDDFKALEPYQQTQVLAGTIYKIPAAMKSAEGGAN